MIRNDLDKWLSTNFTNIELKREGLYSTIYKANDIESKAFIAIKVIKARDRENFNLLNQNLTKARALLHRNIMPIGKIFTGAGFIIAYSMPWGQSLSSRIESGILFLNKELLEFLKDMIAALSFAKYKYGYFHKCIKPENVILVDGVYKLADWDILGLTLKQGTLLSKVKNLGKVVYDSPEILKIRNSKNVNAEILKTDFGKCDLFSLGLVSLRLIGFPESVISEIIYLISIFPEKHFVSEKAEIFGKRLPKWVDPSIAQALDKMLEYNVKKRCEHDFVLSQLNQIKPENLDQKERKFMELFKKSGSEVADQQPKYKKPIMIENVQISDDILITCSGDKSVKMIDMQSGLVIKSFDDICDGKYFLPLLGSLRIIILY